MELYQLRAFVAVAEEGRLTRAAERLNASQPAVSAQIKALEEELGVPLFRREPKGMSLTDPGRLLMDQARKTLAAAEEVVREARGLREEAYGLARVGLNNEPSRLLIPEFLSVMRTRFPRVELHLRQSISHRVLDAVRDGDLEAGFAYENIRTPGGEVAALPLAATPMSVAGPVSWRERLEAADWPELAGLPWVWFPARCPFQTLMQEQFDRRNLAPRTVIVSDSDLTLKTLCAAGCGLTLLRRDDALDAAELGEICLWPGELPDLTLSFVYRRDREHDRVVQALLRAVREVWRLPARRSPAA